MVVLGRRHRYLLPLTSYLSPLTSYLLPPSTSYLLPLTSHSLPHLLPLPSPSHLPLLLTPPPLPPPASPEHVYLPASPSLGRNRASPPAGPCPRSAPSPLRRPTGFGPARASLHRRYPRPGSCVRMLGHEKRVLMIGAHPDDEDTELLAVLVRGMGAETAYLSLNRGEGGQNLIGPELGQALGLIRTEELLAARRLDGARQFFTRAYDFGYSQTLEETRGHWPRDTVLKDVVRIVRRFRPQVVVSVFSGTPRDGHGQHQAAGWAATRGVSAGGGFDPVSRARERGRAGALDPAQALPQHPFRHRRHHPYAGRRRVDPAAGHPSPDRDGGAEPAPLAGHGTDADPGSPRVRLAWSEDRTGRGAEVFSPGSTPASSGAGPVPRRRRRRCRGRLALRREWAAAGVPADELGPSRPRHLRRRGCRVRRRGATTTASSPDSGLTVVLECWNTGTTAHTASASLRSGAGIAPDSGAATLRLEPGALVGRQVTATVRADAPLTAPYFRLGPPEPAAVRLERGPARGARRAFRPARSSTAAFVLDGAARRDAR